MKNYISLLILLAFTLSGFGQSSGTTKMWNARVGNNLYVGDTANLHGSKILLDGISPGLGKILTSDGSGYSTWQLNNSFYNAIRLNDSMIVLQNHIAANNDTLLFSSAKDSSSVGGYGVKIIKSTLKRTITVDTSGLTNATPATRYYVLTHSGSGSVTSVSGTPNRVTSTGGPTPVIDISASYVGQTSITTLGTVSTGSLTNAVTITPPASNTISISGGAVTLNGHSTYQEMDSVSSNSTAWTASYSNILVGQTVQVNYWKTTASDCTITFPSGTTVSNSCPGKPSGLTLVVQGTSANEFFTLWVQRITSTQYLITGAQHTN